MMQKTTKEQISDLLTDETIRKLRDRNDLLKELTQMGIDPSKKIKDAVIKEVM